MKRMLTAAMAAVIGLGLVGTGAVEARPDRHLDIDTGYPHFRAPHPIGLECPGTAPGALAELRRSARPGQAEAIWHRQTGPGGETTILGTTKLRILDVDIRVHRLGDVVFGEGPAQVMDRLSERRRGPRHARSIECTYYRFTPGPDDQYPFAAAFVGTVVVSVPGGFSRAVTG